MHQAHDQHTNNTHRSRPSDIPQLPRDIPSLTANTPRQSTSTGLSERKSRRDAHFPPSPQLHPHVVATSPSNYALSPETVRAPPVPRTRVTRSQSRDHADNPARRDRDTAHSRSLRDNREAEDVQETETVEVGTELGGLKQQIELLSTEITAFTAERDALRSMLASSWKRGKAEVRSMSHYGWPGAR